MIHRLARRTLLGRSLAGLAGTIVAAATRGTPAYAQTTAPSVGQSRHQRRMKLGLVTYNLAHDWDLQTIIDRCKQVGISAVEFRTSHKHGVEPSLNKTQRQEVKKRCADGGLVIWGLGSTCEYHSPDQAQLNQNIQTTRQFIELAADLGAKGVKVRPNGLPKEVDENKTLEQIGQALRTVGQAAADVGVEIWCEMHGSGTSEPSRMRKIMDIADHPNVGVTWNSNRGTDDKDGSVQAAFKLMWPKIYSVHINELVNGYPYRELFSLLNEVGYDRYTLIEASSLRSGDIDDTVRFMRFYKALWEELSRPG